MQAVLVERSGKAVQPVRLLAGARQLPVRLLVWRPVVWRPVVWLLLVWLLVERLPVVDMLLLLLALAAAAFEHQRQARQTYFLGWRVVDRKAVQHRRVVWRQRIRSA